MRSRSTLQGFAFGTVLILASCTDQTDPVAPTNESPPPPPWLPVKARGTIRTPSAVWSLASAGFSSMPRGRPRLTLKIQADGATSSWRWRRTSGPKGWRPGGFTFARVTTTGLSWSGGNPRPARRRSLSLWYVDADEASNRVRIGVERGAGNRIRGSLARLGIPGAAVVIVETEPVRFAAGPGPKPRAKPGGGRVCKG